MLVRHASAHDLYLLPRASTLSPQSLRTALALDHGLHRASATLVQGDHLPHRALHAEEARHQDGEKATTAAMPDPHVFDPEARGQQADDAHHHLQTPVAREAGAGSIAADAAQGDHARGVRNAGLDKLLVGTPSELQYQRRSVCLL